MAVHSATNKNDRGETTWKKCGPWIFLSHLRCSRRRDGWVAGLAQARIHNSVKHSPCIADNWNTGQPVIVVIEQPLTKLFEEHAIQLQRIRLHSDLGIKPSVGDAAMRTRFHIA